MLKQKLIIQLVFLSLILLSACSDKRQKNATAVKTTYTCPMHPQIVQDKPGTCPICGMDLVVFDRTNKDKSLTLSESQVALGNITTTIIGDTTLSNFKQLNGRLAIDPEKTMFVSSRVPGRIDVLYVKETGVKVSKGQPLYKIYSEELAALQQEYLLAVAQVKQFPTDERFNQIEKAARQKLILYGQTQNQVRQLISAQKTDPYVTYSAPVSGVVAELSVGEGQYVSEGGSIMRIEGYDNLWVEADLYPIEASVVKVGQMVKVILTGWEDHPQQVKIKFISPNLQNGNQLLQMRGSISNYKNQWQPGMQANILLPLKVKAKGLSLPVGAIVRDGKGTHAWVEVSKGRFVPRIVKTGMENAESVEITDGLNKGDRVVTTGAYLLYSEYILKKGANPMASHNH
jgi:membrane fusion protein, copper/silver efflux system